jgi:sulfite exporter TauE/SafE
MLLFTTTASIGFIHTVLGPDHYVPFIVLSKAKKWSLNKTVFITLLCGVGHVLSSVILGLIGIIFGISLAKLHLIEDFRGNIAAWLLIAFGLTYLVWGLIHFFRNKPHSHNHIHDTGIHQHQHKHSDDHLHIHEQANPSITPWVLFIIFIFGPCEPLIPLVMYPALQNHFAQVISVALIFSLTTIVTMIGIVCISYLGLIAFSLKNIEKYSHIIAGFTILLCGIGIQFLGL